MDTITISRAILQSLVDLATTEALRLEHERVAVRRALELAERHGDEQQIVKARELYSEALDAAVASQKAVMAGIEALEDGGTGVTKPSVPTAGPSIDGRVMGRGLTLVPAVPAATNACSNCNRTPCARWCPVGRPLEEFPLPLVPKPFCNIAGIHASRDLEQGAYPCECAHCERDCDCHAPREERTNLAGHDCAVTACLDCGKPTCVCAKSAAPGYCGACAPSASVDHAAPRDEERSLVAREHVEPR